MTPQGQLPRAYEALNSLAERIEAGLERALPDIDMYSRRSLAKRTTQAILERLLNPFLRELAARTAAGKDLLPPPRGRFRCGGFRVALSRGEIGVTLPFLIGRIGEFLLLWLYALATMGSWILRAPATGRGAATLVYGVGKENMADAAGSARFQAFCRDGPIGPLARAGRLVVQFVGATPADRAEGGLEYGRFPLHTLLLGQRFQAAWLLQMLRQHFSAMGQYFANVLRAPLLCVLARDYAEQGLALALNQRTLIENVVITNSNYARQPLWMTDAPGRRYRLHIVWYSVSASNPLVYRDDPVVGIFPLVPFLRADELWLWTQGQADFYARLGVAGDAHVVGPVLWYLPEPECAAHSERRRNAYQVAVFDVTPTTPTFARAYGLPYNYYDARNVAAFIEDVVSAQRAAEAALGTEVVFVLKNKRLHAGIHDDEYLSLIRDLSRSGGPIRLVPPETNLFTLISASDLAVVIPFSSPSYVARHLGAADIYHDATGLLASIYERTGTIRFTSGRDELARAFIAALSNRNARSVSRGSLGVLNGTL